MLHDMHAFETGHSFKCVLIRVPISWKVRPQKEKLVFECPSLLNISGIPKYLTDITHAGTKNLNESKIRPTKKRHWGRRSSSLTTVPDGQVFISWATRMEERWEKTELKGSCGR